MDLLTELILAVILMLLEVSTVPVGGGKYSTTFPAFVLRLPRFPSNVQLAVPVVPSTSAEIDTLFAPASISGLLAEILRLTGVTDEGAGFVPPPQALNEIRKQR